jgi:hypothetical protein
MDENSSVTTSSPPPPPSMEATVLKHPSYRPADDRPAPFDGWAVVELVGRGRTAGWITPMRVESMPFVRVEIPAHWKLDGARPVRFFAARAIWCVTPTDEDSAKAVVAEECDVFNREF